MPESVGEVFQASIMVQNMPLRPSPPATVWGLRFLYDIYLFPYIV